jgi:hypothetical protein
MNCPYFLVFKKNTDDFQGNLRIQRILPTFSIISLKKNPYLSNMDIFNTYVTPIVMSYLLITFKIYMLYA